MKYHLKKLVQSTFIRNVVIMATGTIGAQVITLIFSPIITRLYGPDNFGIMGTFNSIIKVIAPVSALTYPISIVLPKREIDAKGLARLSLIITIFMSFLFLVILLIGNKMIINIFNLQQVASFLFLIPLVIIFTGLMQVMQQWLIRTKEFSINAQATFYRSLFINGGKAAFGLVTPYASVLVFLTAIGNGFRAFFMYILIQIKKPFKDRKNSTNESGKRTLRELAKMYYDFPLYRAPERLINSSSQSLPILLLSAFFGSASAGYYTIGWTVISLPSRLIGDAVGHVFYPRVVEAVEKGEKVGRLITRATLMLAVLGTIPFGLIILLGPSIFGFVFGSEWQVAGEYARWVSLLGFTNFINKPVVRSLPALNAQRFHLIFTILKLIMMVSSLVLGFYFFENDIIAIALFAASGSIMNIFLIVITTKMKKNKFENRQR